METQPVNLCPFFNKGKCVLDEAQVSKDWAVSYCISNFSQCEKYNGVEKMERNPYIMTSIMATDCQENIRCKFMKRFIVSGPQCVYMCMALERFLTHSMLEKCIKHWDRCPIMKTYQGE